MLIIDKYNERIERIENLIRLKCTGTPAELAEKLHISERRLYDYIKYLREDKNQSIIYNQRIMSYEYGQK